MDRHFGKYILLYAMVVSSPGMHLVKTHSKMGFVSSVLTLIALIYALKSSQQRSSLSYGQLSIETYGSPLLNSWLDRDLGISGRVILSGGNKEELLFHTNEPVCRIPQLAIHLDRGLNDKGLQVESSISFNSHLG